MKVEHENRRDAIFLSLHRRRSSSGTSRVIALAKSAFTTVASAEYVAFEVVTEVILLPLNSIDSTGSP